MKAPSTGPTTWPRAARVAASVVLAYHLAAVAATELALAPASDLERGAAEGFAPYASLIDQRNGHRFYAPGPPPTPVVTARLRFADGRPERTVRLPDRSVRPRLRYQRQLALAYHLSADAERARSMPEGERESLWARSYARHLCKTTPGCAGVTLYAQWHGFPPRERLREAAGHSGTAGLDPDAEEFYTVPTRIGEFSCDGS